MRHFGIIGYGINGDSWAYDLTPAGMETLRECERRGFLEIMNKKEIDGVPPPCQTPT